MSVYYIKLKTGEELLGLYDPETDPNNEEGESPYVFVEGLISFDTDPETESTYARYWIAHSDFKDVNISLDDVYFFGKANEQADKFYAKFCESVANRERDRNLDNATDEDLEEMMSDRTPGYLH